jgi:hypothetical protein
LSRLFAALNGLMAALFIFAAAVQYNDPDPWRWMAVYLTAAAACAGAFFNRNRALPAAVGLAALAWAAALAPRVPFSGLFARWEMKDAAVEESREFWGLVVVAGWMAALAVRNSRRGAALKRVSKEDL